MEVKKSRISSLRNCMQLSVN